jgi:hypothetical protein
MLHALLIVRVKLAYLGVGLHTVDILLDSLGNEGDRYLRSKGEAFLLVVKSEGLFLQMTKIADRVC